MKMHVFISSALFCLTLAPACHRPLKVKKGDYLLHATPETPPPPAPAPVYPPEPMPQPDPNYHPE